MKRISLLITLAMAACGGSSSDTQPRPSPVPTTTEQPSPSATPPTPMPTQSVVTAGELDLSFGVDGIAVVPVRGVVSNARRGLFVYPDGRTSLLALKRPDVNLDAELLRIDLPADGRGAVLSTPLPSFRVVAAAFAADGSSIVIGERGDEVGEVVAARLTPNGDLDTAFGDAGFAATSPEFARDVVALPDGRSVVLGRSLVRLTVDGAFDVSFGHDGVLPMPTPVPPASDEFFGPTDIGVTADGRFVVAADYSVSISVTPQLLALTSSGEFDGTFGDMGRVSYSGLGAGGRLLVAADGAVRWLVQGEILLVSSDGNDVTTVADRPLEVGLEDLAETASGSLVAGGFSWVPDEPRRFDCELPDPSRCPRRAVAVQSIGADGVLDPSFGDEGTVRTDLPAPYGAQGTGGQAIVAAPAGRLTVAGTACRAPTDCDLVVLRYSAP